MSIGTDPTGVCAIIAPPDGAAIVINVAKARSAGAVKRQRGLALGAGYGPPLVDAWPNKVVAIEEASALPNRTRAESFDISTERPIRTPSRSALLQTLFHCDRMVRSDDFDRMNPDTPLSDCTGIARQPERL